MLTIDPTGAVLADTMTISLIRARRSRYMGLGLATGLSR